MEREIGTGRERYEALCREHRWEVPERYNIAADVCDRHAPDAPAMIHERHDGVVRELVWGELQTLANQAAHMLGALGVGRGDRVAVVLPATPEAAAVFFATWKLGAILLSMSVLYGDDGIAHRLNDSDPKVLVTDAENAPRFSDIGGIRLLILDPAELARESQTPVHADTAAEDPAQLYYTSGTTSLAFRVASGHGPI
jgi:acetyl-CoA synthetase